MTRARATMIPRRVSSARTASTASSAVKSTSTLASVFRMNQRAGGRPGGGGEGAAAEVLGVGEEQRRVVPVDDQSRDRLRLRVVVDVVHARQPRHQALDSVVRAAHPEQQLGDRQAHRRQHPVQDVESQDSRARRQGQYELAAAEGGQPPERPDVDQVHRGVNDDRGQRGQREEARTGRANSRTPMTEASAVSEYAWVRAPAARAMAVLLALLLIGNPRSRLAPAFDTPSASSSAFASMAVAAALERPCGQHVVAEGYQEHAQRGQYQFPHVMQGHGGDPGGGRPAGMCPASATPCPPSPKMAHAAVLSSTAASGPGSRGHQAAPRTRTPAPLRRSPCHPACPAPAGRRTRSPGR